MNALLEAVIGHFLRHFDILNESLSLVGVEASSVHLHLETKAVNNLDLSGGKGVQLGHALHFDELHIVAILEFVTLIFVNGDNAGIGLGRCHHDEGLGVLAIGIGDTEIVTIVKEGETLRAVGLREDEPDVLGADELVDFDHLIDAVEDLSVGNHMVVCMVFKSKGSDNVDLDIWVEFLKFPEAGTSAGCLSNVLFFAVKVG